MKRGALLAAAMAWCAVGVAQPSAPAELLHKERFVRRLLEAGQPQAGADSVAADLHAQAVSHLERGEYREAQARLDESIRILQKRHAAGRAVVARERTYERVRASVHLMRTTFARHAGAHLAPGSRVLPEVDLALEQAEQMRSLGKPREAIRALERAEQSLTHALTHLLGTVTVTYAPRFSGPQEEFRYEEERNRAYAALIPAAIRELRPSGPALVLVQQYVDSSEASAARAAGHAREGDWRAALDSIRAATRFLQQGLGAAGLAVPQGFGE